MLVTIEDVLAGEELSQVRDMLTRSPWEDGEATAGPQAAQVKNNLQVPEHAPYHPLLRRIVLDALNRQPLFFTAALPLKVLPPQFNRYEGGRNAYGWHVDNAMRLVPGQAGIYVRSDVSATIFLSNPADYEGGVLTVEDTFGRHELKLPAGSLVLYPSSSVHRVTPVTRGARIACFLFIQSMVRDAGQRRLLYDMDMALLRLRNDIGDTEPVVQLTSTYHNLLRAWAQP